MRIDLGKTPITFWAWLRINADNQITYVGLDSLGIQLMPTHEITSQKARDATLRAFLQAQ